MKVFGREEKKLSFKEFVGNIKFPLSTSFIILSCDSFFPLSFSISAWPAIFSLSLSSSSSRLDFRKCKQHFRPKFERFFFSSVPLVLADLQFYAVWKSNRVVSSYFFFLTRPDFFSNLPSEIFQCAPRILLAISLFSSTVSSLEVLLSQVTYIFFLLLLSLFLHFLFLNIKSKSSDYPLISCPDTALSFPETLFLLFYNPSLPAVFIFLLLRQKRGFSSTKAAQFPGFLYYFSLPLFLT